MPRRRLDIPAEKISYKHPEFLGKFVSETGKIFPRRVTGVSAKLHRRITREIKRARSLNMMG
ncbi:MAG: 30S ribosomal protein S18 [Verrucomicrobiota bacterium]